jgi:drug/metabolite transporter (DMT)-like permease
VSIAVLIVLAAALVWGLNQLACRGLVQSLGQDASMSSTVFFGGCPPTHPPTHAVIPLIQDLSRYLEK